MDDAEGHDSDVIDLVLQLCRRIGMMMEDANPLALDASREGLNERVADLASAARAIATVADAAEALLGR